MGPLDCGDLPGNTRAIAFWIASRCADSWPVTISTIVADSGFSSATVKRAIADLVRLGWIVCQSDRKSGNRYELEIPTLAHGESTDGSQRANRIAHSEPSKGNQLAHCEPTDGSQRANRIAHSEPSKGNPLAHHEPTDGSQRANRMAHSEPTYTRTKQEQKEHRACAYACAHAREAATSFLDHDQVDMSKLWSWSRQLILIPEVKKKVLESFDKGDGTIHLDAFVTALYTTRRVYEQYRPWLEKLAREGRL